MSKIYQGQPLKLLVKGLDEAGATLTTIGATTTDLEVKKPDGTIVTWNGSIYATDENYVEYDAAGDVVPYTAADLDQVGRYSVQAIIDDAGGNGPWPGDSVQFEVHARHT